MSFGQAILLGLLQGATEFLPVSSSGHLVLIPALLGWSPGGLAFDTLLHWGTAVAVLGYFWRDWLALVAGCWRALRNRSWDDPQARLAGWIILASVPAAVVGFLLEDLFEAVFDRPAAAAGFLLVTAGILSLAEWASRRERRLEQMSWVDALLIGLAQAAAIFPGVSRSGATIAAGMGRGLTRESAARFSFLLATPVILGAGLFQLVDLAQTSGLSGQVPLLIGGFVAALIAGLSCIHFLLYYLQRRFLYPFAIYCAAFGVVALILLAV